MNSNFINDCVALNLKMLASARTSLGKNEKYFELNNTTLLSFHLFRRFYELHSSLLRLVLSNDYVGACIILRSMCEAYILLKSSVQNPTDFFEKHVYESRVDIKKWGAGMSKIKGFEKEFYEKMSKGQTTLKDLTVEGEGLGRIIGLFEKLGEEDLYNSTYRFASKFVHHNFFSLNKGFESGEVLDFENRDFNNELHAVCCHAADLMLFTCSELGNLKEFNHFDESLLKELRDELEHNTSLKDYS